MPVTVEIADDAADPGSINDVFAYFSWVDNTFSTYKKSSEISKYNQKLMPESELSKTVQSVLRLADKTKKETYGYFDIERNGKIDPSGIVKGWAILNASKILRKLGYQNFFVEAGGDIQVAGKNCHSDSWTVGIRNPYNRAENVKILSLKDKGIATSGTSVRGQHIYNPHEPGKKLEEIVSLTVIGPDVLEADRFATAAYAMGRKGIEFIENLSGFEAYMIDSERTATFTSGFERFVKKYAEND